MYYWIWFIIAAVFLLVEALTTEMVSIWFAAAAIVSGVIGAIFPTLEILWQILIFVGAAAVLLLSTRKVVKKFLKGKKNQETNLDLYIGHVAVVVDEIDNVEGKGCVKINGNYWTARSENGEKIEENARVIFKRIEGNKAIVERQQSTENN